MNQYEVENALEYGAIKPILKKWWKLSEYEIFDNLDEIMAELREVSGRNNLDNIAVYIALRADCGCVLCRVILAEITPANQPRREL